MPIPTKARSRYHSLLFMERFHAAILDGRKRQTIRRIRKRPIMPGDTLSLRGWEGLPYRSQQTVLDLATCHSVASIEIDYDIAGRFRVVVGGKVLSPAELDSFQFASPVPDSPFDAEAPLDSTPAPVAEEASGSIQAPRWPWSEGAPRPESVPPYLIAGWKPPSIDGATEGPDDAN